MAKINKVYPPFFNGVSQQSPELILDNQCQEMLNCVPDLVQGLTKRPPVKYQDRRTDSWVTNASVFHTYDRGEDNEEYIFVETGDTSNPVRAYHKDGTEMNVVYNAANETVIKSYLNNGNLRGLTVQDRTWVFSKNATVSLDLSATAPLDANYTKTAYYWLKRGSGDRYNPYNYAVYLNGTSYSVDPDKPSGATEDPVTGAEDSDVAASLLAAKIPSGTWNVTVVGSILKISRVDGADFTFDSWDSWGNQASEGWKGSVNKVSDLPKDFPWLNTYVEIRGEENNKFTDYYVKWNGSSWEECLDPEADRGQLSNMPIKCDRTALVAGIATFTFDLIDWATPRVGNTDNNPDPTFVGYQIQDLFFYKNRLGIGSTDSVTLSGSAKYTDFYIETALDVIETDPVDLTVASNQASKIHFVKPFNNSLYIFTKYAQYELVSGGVFGPTTVSLDNVTNYPMAIDVEPVVVNDSLYFISTTDNRQQLREYIKTEKLSVKGIDLNVSTPTYLEDTITSIVADGVLGMVLLGTANNKLYVYNFKEDGGKRVQSSWSTWTILEGLDYVADSFEYYKLASTVVVTCKVVVDSQTEYRYHQLILDYPTANDNVDTSFGQAGDEEYAYESSVKLPRYYPQFTNVRTPKNKILIKKISIEGTGSFDAELYRTDYGVTLTKSHNSSLADLDFHVSSKVDEFDVTIKDSTTDDFQITSIVVEGLYQPTSKELR